ncbi:MAG: 1-phosphofructokinase family hexose kinase [Oscillospiraceae bacterium]|nr:1-phosphofructokinase family hexose kinase [Oscillospiraceae bacterium]
MTTTVTLSPCLDKTVACERFDVDSMNRVELLSLDIGGKGINVSRALKRLGLKTKAIGLNFSGGEVIERTLERENIPHDFIKCEGDLRINLKVFDRSRLSTIEINEKSAYVDSNHLNGFTDSFIRAVRKSDNLVLTGSLPQGVPTDIYKTLGELAKRENPEIRLILDAQGEVLLKGLEAKPFMIKPNLYELEATFGVNLETNDDIVALCRKIISDYGVTVVLASMGANGAVIVTSDEVIYREAVKVDVKSTQGAGDSMVAGACLAMSKGLSLDETLDYAVCCAAGAISGIGTSFCDPDRLNELLSK